MTLDVQLHLREVPDVQGDHRQNVHHADADGRHHPHVKLGLLRHGRDDQPVDRARILVEDDIDHVGPRLQQEEQVQVVHLVEEHRRHRPPSNPCVAEVQLDKLGEQAPLIDAVDALGASFQQRPVLVRREPVVVDYLGPRHGAVRRDRATNSIGQQHLELQCGRPGLVLDEPDFEGFPELPGLECQRTGHGVVLGPGLGRGVLGPVANRGQAFQLAKPDDVDRDFLG
mmetsp:Transcript_78739/g.227679  ORF Transcript_78739/g.227679 Transcript_78739/m.227679 type:complete len:227 (-) Transcript_78739:106-786(-)